MSRSRKCHLVLSYIRQPDHFANSCPATPDPERMKLTWAPFRRIFSGRGGAVQSRLASSCLATQESYMTCAMGILDWVLGSSASSQVHRAKNSDFAQFLEFHDASSPMHPTANLEPPAAPNSQPLTKEREASPRPCLCQRPHPSRTGSWHTRSGSGGRSLDLTV